ncbi:MAG: tripartite tricarboxylate transporter substrate-binding protein, partial [bacterium]|nr:tripartite tricarboxylate transporter substrate-binding protein [bacterium]
MRSAISLCALLCAACGGVALAADFPAKPVRIIIGFPPGGATDLVSRLMAPKYVEIFKQQFIVDNRSGANGVIGSDLAAKAAPDGHTIHLATIGTLVISP